MKKKKKVSPIPKGYRTLTPYLALQGAGQAIEFYKKAFGAKERMRMNGPDGKVGHAELLIGDCVLMMADEFPGMNTSPATLKGTSVTLMLYVKDVDAAFKKALDMGATAVFPPADKFYGDRAGVVSDPFGHVWCLATHVEDVPPKEMAKRAAAEAAPKKQDSGTKNQDSPGAQS
jgi:PhnB protein